MKFVSAILVTAALAGCASGGSGAGAHAQKLDGSTFAVALKPDGQAPMPDKLIFADGIFESTVCTGAGFKKSAYSSYSASSGPSATEFAVECDSPTMGHNDWHGTVEGDHVDGTLVRTPKDGSAPIHMTFSGDRVR